MYLYICILHSKNQRIYSNTAALTLVSLQMRVLSLRQLESGKLAAPPRQILQDHCSEIYLYVPKHCHLTPIDRNDVIVTSTGSRCQNYPVNPNPSSLSRRALPQPPQRHDCPKDLLRICATNPCNIIQGSLALILHLLIFINAEVRCNTTLSQTKARRV